MSPLPPADSGLRGLSPTVTFRSGISGDELANGCGDCDGRIVGRDRRECDFRSNPVAAGRAHALCCESRFSQFVKSASQATPDCNRDFHRKGRKRSLQRLHTSLNFQYRRINPCTLSTEMEGARDSEMRRRALQALPDGCEGGLVRRAEATFPAGYFTSIRSLRP